MIATGLRRTFTVVVVTIIRQSTVLISQLAWCLASVMTIGRAERVDCLRGQDRACSSGEAG